MRKALPVFVCGFLLIAFLAACTPVTATPDQADVATIVASTLEAASLNSSLPPASPEGSADPSSSAHTSPPTLTVAYTVDGDLWSLSGMDAPVQRTRSGGITSVLLSDDGRLALYIRSTEDGDQELHSLDLSNGSDLLLFNQADLDALYPPDPGAMLRFDTTNLQFIPDSHQFFLSTRYEYEGPGASPNLDLFILNAENGDWRSLLDVDEGGRIFLSPDGTTMALTTPTSIRFASTDGTPLGDSRLTFDPVITYSEYAYFPQVIWLPDSQAVLAVIPSPDPFAPDSSATIWRVPVSGPEPAALQTFPGSLFMLDAFGQVWVDPTGGQIALLQAAGDGGERSLSIVPLGGGDATFIAEGSLEWNGWSPDGSLFSYRTLGPDAMLMLADLEDVRAVIPGGIALAWVDGGVVVLGGRTGDWTLFLHTLDGSTTNLATIPGDWVTYDAVTH